MYDAAGNRVLRRSTSNSTTTLTAYPFDSEEHTYSGTGTLQSSIYYYTLSGRLIGELTSSPAQTNIILTDALGSVLATFSNTANSADLLGNQVYGPYGSQNYQSGTLGTNKGFTGHYADATGLDYYNARYYDPVAGVFLSADSAQGNLQGMNPYGYVGGNPETRSDPTGKYVACGDTCGSGPSSPSNPSNPSTPTPTLPITLTGNGLRLCQLNGGCGQRVQKFDRPALLMLCGINPQCRKWEAEQSFDAGMMFLAEIGTMIVAGAELATFGTGLLALYGLAGHPEEDQALLNDLTTSSAEMATAYQQEEEALTQELEGNGVLSGACSFISQTLVATNRGEQPIGKLHVGDKVWAYNPTTRKMELEPVLHVWIHQDNDLVDLTISTPITSKHGSSTVTSEVLHTNKKHPFFTKEQGFLAVGKITLGMHILRADGRVGAVTGWKVVLGTKVMYNLEVQQDHTFTVGVGQWIVHNLCGPSADLGQARENYVQDNLSTLIPDSGNVVGTRTPLLTGRGSTDIDIETENAVIEIGGPMKGMTPQSFANQLGKLQTYALQEGKGLYFLYDASAGSMSLAIQGIAAKYGATVVPFTLQSP